jgi:type II secretory pathway predicted ATPase ExeA
MYADQELIILDSAGFLLIDDLFHPVYANPESIRILGYPNNIPDAASIDGILKQKILTFLPRDIATSQNDCVLQFQSGRRRYLCRAFVLENNWNGGDSGTRIALILERGLPSPPSDNKKRLKYGGTYEDPFSFTPDPKYYHFSRTNQEVVGTLAGVVRDSRGIGVLFGQAGMGKTVLLNYLTEKIRGESEIVSIPGSFESHDDLICAVMSLLGVEAKGGGVFENVRHLEAGLLSKYKSGKKVTLICDDAHKMSEDSLSSLCALADLQTTSKKLIQIMIAGRQELLQKMTVIKSESFSRQANVFCRLAPLDEAEVSSYVLHRLRIAGCMRQVFSSDALSAVALYSRGIPLNINMICRHALALAATINLQFIDEKIVTDSAYDLVLKAQPSSGFDAPIKSNRLKKASGSPADRRGLRLVRN